MFATSAQYFYNIAQVFLSRRIVNQYIVHRFYTNSMPCMAVSPLEQYSSWDEVNPIGAHKNLYLPYGVIKVVSNWLSFSRGTCQ